MASSGLLGPENFPAWVIPALPPRPPSQDVLRYVHETRGPSIVATMSVLSGLAVATVVGRFYARRVRKLPCAADDYVMIPALIFSLGLCILNITAVQYGMGRHVWVVWFSDDIEMLKMGFALSLLYVLAQFSIKMSILLLYRRIFTTLDRSFRLSLYCLMTYTTIWATAVFLYCFFACRPLPFFWDKSIPGGFCYSNNGVAVPNALSSVADVGILILPCLVLWRLHMSTGRKVGLTLLFLIGIFTCTVSMVRIVMTYKGGPDWTWQDAELWVWTAVEAVVGVLCGCFPVIAPAFSGDLFKKRLGTTRAGRFFERIFTTKRSSHPSRPNAPRPNMQLNHWPSSNGNASRHAKDSSTSAETLAAQRAVGCLWEKAGSEGSERTIHVHTVIEEDNYEMPHLGPYMQDEEKALSQQRVKTHIWK